MKIHKLFFFLALCLSLIALNRSTFGQSRVALQKAQEALKNLGYDPGPIDGVAGRKTVQALSSYQEANGLSVTGKLDQATATQLLPKAALNGAKKSRPVLASTPRRLRLSVIVPRLQKVVGSRDSDGFSAGSTTVIDLRSGDDPDWTSAVRGAVTEALASLNVEIVDDPTVDELRVTFNGYSEYSPRQLVS
jgi:peptidoglycan hydrolase-like protein with peptidoglycan-binding domain